MLLKQGRRYCARCNRVLCVVYDPDVTEMRCPRCDELTVETCGPDLLSAMRKTKSSSAPFLFDRQNPELIPRDTHVIEAPEVKRLAGQKQKRKIMKKYHSVVK